MCSVDNRECFTNMKKDLRQYQGDDRVVSSHEFIEALKNIPEPNTFSVNIPALQRITGGFAEGETWVVTGPTGCGKTSLLQNISNQFGEKDIRSLWFNFEVPDRQFIKKFNEPTPLFYLPLKRKNHDFEWLKERMVESMLKYQVKVIFIDHLHYLFDLVQSKNVSLEIGALVRKLKTFCNLTGAVIFLVSHMAKVGNVTADWEPHHDDIRDSQLTSGEVDGVIAIWRKPNEEGKGRNRKSYRDLNETDNLATIKVTKNRRTGIQGKFDVVFENGVFIEIDKKVEQDIDRGINPEDIFK